MTHIHATTGEIIHALTINPQHRYHGIGKPPGGPKGPWCRPDSSPTGTVARVHGTSVNQLIIDSLATEIDRVRSDADFMSRARRLLERDQAIIDRLAE